MKHTILSLLPPDFPWKDRLHWFSEIDSTNTAARQMAAQGAPHGTILIAGQQTAGRGRMGRSFCSPAGMGVYLSVILRPGCAPTALMHLTCAAGVAMCDAVEDAAGFRPGIKWINDLVFGTKKLGGILTELSVNPATGLVDWAIVGIGINCRQQIADFPPELQSMAASLSMAADREVSPGALAAAMVTRLQKMDALLLTAPKEILDRYRRDCMTLGKDIQVIRGDTVRHGTALDLASDGSLLVRFTGGTTEAVNSGEVSVRGMYGYL